MLVFLSFCLVQLFTIKYVVKKNTKSMKRCLSRWLRVQKCNSSYSRMRSSLVKHMEKQEMEVEWKLETENGNGNWKRKYKSGWSLTCPNRFACCCWLVVRMHPELQWRSQNTADARAQRGHTTFASCLVPRPRPAFSRLQ